MKFTFLQCVQWVHQLLETGIVAKSMGRDAANSDNKIKELEANVKRLEKAIEVMMDLMRSQSNIRQEFDKLKPMQLKDMKEPVEYDGTRTMFKTWHESFTSWLRARNKNWDEIIDFIRSHKSKRFMDSSHAKEEYYAARTEDGEVPKFSRTKSMRTSSNIETISTST